MGKSKRLYQIPVGREIEDNQNTRWKIIKHMLPFTKLKNGEMVAYIDIMEELLLTDENLYRIEADLSKYQTSIK